MAEETAPEAVADQATAEAPEAVQAATSDTTASTTVDTADKAPAPQEASAEEQLLSQEELSKYPDPQSQIKAMQKAFTQKTQKLAPYRRLIESLEKDPQATVKALAAQLKLQVQEPQATSTPEVDETVQYIESTFGKQAAEAFRRLAEKTIESKVAPLQEFQQRLTVEAAAKQSQATLEALTAKHPDWKNYEGKMVELGGRLQPNGMSESDYLETLYYLATKDRSEADKTAKVVERINKSAASAESPTTGVAPSRVAPTMPAGLSFSEQLRYAAKAAEQGIELN